MSVQAKKKSRTLGPDASFHLKWLSRQPADWVPLNSDLTPGAQAGTTPVDGLVYHYADAFDEPPGHAWKPAIGAVRRASVLNAELSRHKIDSVRTDVPDTFPYCLALFRSDFIGHLGSIGRGFIVP
jgi:hypothetical protein